MSCLRNELKRIAQGEALEEITSDEMNKAIELYNEYITLSEEEKAEVENYEELAQFTLKSVGGDTFFCPTRIFRRQNAPFSSTPR